MGMNREYRTLQAFTEQQLESMLAYFTPRGWKPLGPARDIPPESLCKLATIQRVIFLDPPVAPSVPQGNAPTAHPAPPA